MKTKTLDWMLAAVLALVSANLVAAADTVKPVQLSDLAPALQKAIKTQTGDGQLLKVASADEDGETVYEAEIKSQGKTRSFKLNEDGELLESEVFLEETPPPVQAAIRKHAGKGEILSINKTGQAEELAYDVEIKREGKTRTFSLGEKGELLEMQMFLDELPAAVRKAIPQHQGGAELQEINLALEDGETVYDVALSQGEKTIDLSFDPSGSLLSKEESLTIEEAPAPVQRTLRAHLKGGKLISLSKVTENGAIHYFAEVRRNQKRESLTIGPRGKVLAEGE